jgi:hypothetical protein
MNINRAIRYVEDKVVSLKDPITTIMMDLWNAISQHCNRD